MDPNVSFKLARRRVTQRSRRKLFHLALPPGRLAGEIIFYERKRERIVCDALNCSNLYERPTKFVVLLKT